MVVVDSSVWIDFFRSTPSHAVVALKRLLEQGVVQIIVPDLVLFEVLRGFRHERDHRQAKALMQSLQVESTVNAHLALAAANHYRALVSQGYTVKSAVDILLGAFCIENDYTLLHQDRDFEMMHRIRGLKVLALAAEPQAI